MLQHRLVSNCILPFPMSNGTPPLFTIYIIIIIIIMISYKVIQKKENRNYNLKGIDKITNSLLTKVKTMDILIRQ